MKWLIVMFLCNPANESECITIHDKWGPYETKELCEARGVQLVNIIMYSMPPSKIMWKCEMEGDMI